MFIKFSDLSKVKDQYFAALKKQAATMHVKRNSVDFKFASWVQDIDVVLPSIHWESTKLLALDKPVKNWRAVDTHDVPREHFTLCTHRAPQLFANGKARFVESKNVAVESTLFLNYVHEIELHNRQGLQLKSVDLTKFTFRNYSDNLLNVRINMQNGECVFYSELLNKPLIDTELLVDWCTHQLLSQLFEIKSQPFIEKDGLVHRQMNDYSLEDVYDIPSEVRDLGASLAKLRIGRASTYNEYFNS